MKCMRKARCFVIFSVMVLLTACGNPKKDDIADDLRQNAGQDASAGNAVKNSGTDEIPENVSYVIEVGGNTTKVNAEVSADGYGKVPTLKVEECTDKDEWIRKYAKRLFDDGEFQNVKPYAVQSREELEAELQYYKEKYADSTVFSENDNTWQIENRLENYNEENHGAYPDDKLVYEIQSSEEDDEYSTYSDVHQAYLRGMVDGRTWTLSYYDGYNEFEINGEKRKERWIPQLRAQCIDEEYFVSNSSHINETYLNNACKREDAEKEAQEFLYRLGFGEMELLHIVQNNMQPENGELKTDGYTMVFGFKQGGAHLLFSAGGITTSMDMYENNTAAQPYVEVVVNSNGIYSLMIMGAYNEAEVMSDESAMLSFEQINELAKTRITEIMTDFPSSYFEIDAIEFGYVYITYDGLSYAAVPVWRYYNGEKNDKFRSSVLTICALDGAEIYPVSGSLYYGSGTIAY